MRRRPPGWRRMESGVIGAAAIAGAVQGGFGFLSTLTDWISGKSAKAERAAWAAAGAEKATAHARIVEAETAWKIAQLQAATGGVPAWAIAGGIGLAVFLVARRKGA